MNDDITMYYIMGAIIALVIFYFIIKGAVRSGTSELKAQMKMQNRLLMRRMIKEGYTIEQFYQAETDDEITHLGRLKSEHDKNSPK